MKILKEVLKSFLLVDIIVIGLVLILLGIGVIQREIKKREAPLIVPFERIQGSENSDIDWIGTYENIREILKLEDGEDFYFVKDSGVEGFLYYEGDYSISLDSLHDTEIEKGDNIFSGGFRISTSDGGHINNYRVSFERDEITIFRRPKIKNTGFSGMSMEGLQELQKENNICGRDFFKVISKIDFWDIYEKCEKRFHLRIEDKIVDKEYADFFKSIFKEDQNKIILLEENSETVLDKDITLRGKYFWITVYNNGLSYIKYIYKIS